MNFRVRFSRLTGIFHSNLRAVDCVDAFHSFTKKRKWIVLLAQSNFRKRGLNVAVDTTEPAEFEIAGHQISDAAMERIAARLKAVTFSKEDRVVGDIRIRALEGFDIIFMVGRQDADIVITIGGVLMPDPGNPTEKILQKLGKVAIFRGASGL